MDCEILVELLTAHATPGDEEAVAAIIGREWRKSGWTVTRHGHYAMSARRRADSARTKPRLLICAHMDSPGFAIDAFLEDGAARIVPLGGAHFAGESAAGRLKTAGGEHAVVIRQAGEDEDERPSYRISEFSADTRHGDRVCFLAAPEISAAGAIASPFLDNRLGCWALCELAHRLGGLDCPWEIVLGATACEEIGGFGAPVLARAAAPDAVFCLDATYEDKDQNVLVGRGPVLTLSDASVILSPAVRDRFMALFGQAGIPLQTEVYNYSGTDSRAFPHAGLAGPVYALLLPTRGNHSPREEGSLADAENLLAGIEMLLTCGNLC